MIKIRSDGEIKVLAYWWSLAGMGVRSATKGLRYGPYIAWGVWIRC